MDRRNLTNAATLALLGLGLAGSGRPGADERLPAGEGPRASQPAAAAAQDPLAAWRANLELLTRDGTIWWTSNEAHAAEDGGIEAYAMRYEPIGPGLAVRGCMWGERGEEIVGPFWEFFLGWDPVAGDGGIAYQASPGGIVGNGSLVALPGGRSVMDQTFRNPDGTTFRVRHEAEHPDDDTHVTRSFDLVGETWEARRSYTWKRRAWDPPAPGGGVTGAAAAGPPC